MISHALLSLLAIEITADYRTNGFVASELPGFSHTVPTFKSDLPCWFLVVFFAGNLFWWITTSLPVMYRKDLYKYMGRED